jgi:hypothetical protein
MRSRAVSLALAAVPAILIAAMPARADVPTVTDAAAIPVGDAWRFDVTVRHGDTGWDHYADAWTVSAPDGTVLGTRILLHPHVDEQPFTRSLDGVAVPGGVDEVRIRARDSVHGWGEVFVLRLPR